MSEADLHHLAAAYALDALDLDERRAFEAHYPTCPECSREVAEFRATAAALAEDATTSAPPELRAKVMAEIGRTRQLSPVDPAEPTEPTGDAVRPSLWRRPGGIATGALAAAAVLVLAIGAGLLLRSDPEPDPIGELLAAPDARVVPLTPTEAIPDGGPAADATLRVVVSDERGRVAVVGDGLPDPGAGSTYELWFVTPDGATPAGLFGPDGDGAVSEVLALAAGAPANVEGLVLGVTIEPDGGSPQPTSDVLYLGQA